MENVRTPQMEPDEVSRRKLIRKAAYTAPAVFAIAAAPASALGSSGRPRKPKKPKKPSKPGRGNKKPPRSKKRN